MTLKEEQGIAPCHGQIIGVDGGLLAAGIMTGGTKSLKMLMHPTPSG
jgi:hypothetical protein